MRPIAILLVAVAFLAACRGRSEDGPAPVLPPPPPGTGQVRIEMEGRWEVEFLVRVDDPTRPVPNASFPGLSFMPLHLGHVLTVRRGQLVGGDGDALFRVWSGLQENQRYVNVADGRFVVFDFLNQGVRDCFWHYGAIGRASCCSVGPAPGLGAGSRSKRRSEPVPIGCTWAGFPRSSDWSESRGRDRTCAVPGHGGHQGSRVCTGGGRARWIAGGQLRSPGGT
jgi:hypothetical protein